MFGKVLKIFKNPLFLLALLVSSACLYGKILLDKKGEVLGQNAGELCLYCENCTLPDGGTGTHQCSGKVKENRKCEYDPSVNPACTECKACGNGTCDVCEGSDWCPKDCGGEGKPCGDKKENCCPAQNSETTASITSSIIFYCRSLSCTQSDGRWAKRCDNSNSFYNRSVSGKVMDPCSGLSDEDRKRVAPDCRCYAWQIDWLDSSGAVRGWRMGDGDASYCVAPTPTSTLMPTPTLTPTPTPTCTPTPTLSPTPMVPTFTPTSVPTSTPKPKPTLTPVPTSTPTFVLTPTETPKPTSTPTPTTTPTPIIPKGKFKVCKFDDRNNNRSWDEDEAGLSWSFRYRINGGSWQGYKTSADWWRFWRQQGCGPLISLTAGDQVEVEEESRTGWQHTTPSQVVFSIEENKVRVLEFGNKQELIPTPTPTPTSVISQMPVCQNLTLSPRSGSYDLLVTAIVSGTDPDGIIKEYRVNWGDGSADQYGVSDVFTHVYNRSGVFYVNAWVKDNDGHWSGGSGDCVRSVDVTEPPKKENQKPVCQRLIASVSRGEAPLTVNFEVDAYDPDGSLRLYLWEFGDGGSEEKEQPATQHSYNNEGKYTVSARVKDNGNQWSDYTDNCKVEIEVVRKPQVLGAAVPKKAPAAGWPWGIFGALGILGLFLLAL